MFIYKSKRANLPTTLFVSHKQNINDASFSIHKAYCKELNVDVNMVPYYPASMVASLVAIENLDEAFNNETIVPFGTSVRLIRADL